MMTLSEILAENELTVEEQLVLISAMVLEQQVCFDMDDLQ